MQKGSGNHEARAVLGCSGPALAEPRLTFGSRCRCVITSVPLASLDYAVCFFHLQQDPGSSIPFEFLRFIASRGTF